MERRSSGFGLLLLATAIGGIAGYLLTWMVPREVGFAQYAPFAVFWAFLFLLVSALSGVQQEVTRATSASDHSGGARRILALAGLLSGAVLVLVIATAPLWVGAAFPDHGWALVWPLAVGAASYVVAAVVYGSLYGLQQWRALFMLLTLEALSRLVAITVVLQVAPTIVPLVWAVALPIPFSLLALSLRVRRAFHAGSRLDVGYGQLTWNFARTVAAATSMGILVSGFPLVLGVTSATQPRAHLGLMISAITLVRAPLIIVALALQSYLVVYFRSSGDKLRRRLLGLSALVIAASGILALIMLLAGPQAFALLFPGELVPDASLLVALVLSSALVALLCLSAPAVLSRSQHAPYSVGWITAAATTVIVLSLPIEFEARTLLALFVGPAAGLVIHGVALALPVRAREVSE